MENTQSSKNTAIKAIEALPEGATLDDILYHIYVLKKINEGLKSAEEEELIDHDQLKLEILKW